MSLALAALVALLSPPSPVEAPHVVAPVNGRVALERTTADVDGDGLADAITLESRRNGIFLVVMTGAGTRAEKGLGIEPAAFRLEGTPVRLATRDLTGDGRPEILAAAAVGDRALLFVLDWTEGGLASIITDSDSFEAMVWAPDAIEVGAQGEISLATLRPDAAGTRATRDVWSWSADANDFEWRDPADVK